MAFIKYGMMWQDTYHPVEIERYCIRRDGEWRSPIGTKCGAGLFTHYRNLMSLLWPGDDHHRWSDLILKSWLEERILVVMGCRDSGKTYVISKCVLIDYWAYPEETLTLMTSTTIQGLENRIWGTIKRLWRIAREHYGKLEGVVVDAKHGLFTDDISENAELRDMNKGILGIPILSSQDEFLGSALRNFAGIKQTRRRLVGDELQFIHPDYLKTLDAFDKGDFKGAFAGNPIANNGKALDKISEPEAGWNSLGEVTKTKTWRNKYGGLTINLVGIDSPNFDPETKDKFPYLVDQSDVDSVSKRPGGKDSVEWWSLIMGIRKAGAISDRVLTVELVELCGGFKDVVWSMEPPIKGYAIDAGYGGDPCVATYFECGQEAIGRQNQNVMAFGEPKIIPIQLSTGQTAEDQIAEFVRDDIAALGVPDSNVFVECGMRATLAVRMSQVVGLGINAINFGGPATQRAVSNDLFVFDEQTQQRRLKTCYEHYSKFVSELAFSVRELVQSKQARRFPRLAAEEFAKRLTKFVYNDRHEIESKVDYKARNSGESPNFSDSTMIAVEGARRLGFVIERLADGTSRPQTSDWLDAEIRNQKQERRKNELTYT